MNILKAYAYSEGIRALMLCVLNYACEVDVNVKYFAEEEIRNLCKGGGGYTIIR